MIKARLALAVIGLASAGAAQSPRLPSSFAIVAPSVDPRAVLTARPGGTLLSLAARPATAVVLEDAIQPEVAQRIGAKGTAGVQVGRALYGWPERPDIYCDLLRNSGLGAGAFCLLDRDRDGRFDAGQRVGFNSASADLLLVTPSGKIIGAQMKGDPISLPAPVRYARQVPSATVTGRLDVTWSNDRTADAFRVEIGTPENHTATAGRAERYLLVPRRKVPLTVELYGVRIAIAGFDEKGAMRYSILSVVDGEAVPLVFIGHRLVIIGY